MEEELDHWGVDLDHSFGVKNTILYFWSLLAWIKDGCDSNILRQSYGEKISKYICIL